MMQNTDGYYICRGMWETVNEDAAFALGVGDISPVVKSRAGFSVFQRCEKNEERIEAQISSIAESYGKAVFALYVENVRDSLQAEKLDKYNEINILEMTFRDEAEK